MFGVPADFAQTGRGCGNVERRWKVNDGETGPVGLVGKLVAERRRERGLTLQRLADLVGCAKSYLSMIERGRSGPPGEELLAKLERALLLEPGRLVRAARWEATPAEVRREVEAMRSGRGAAARLAEILDAGGIDSRGRVKGALDEAYRSGELRRLVDRLAPDEEKDRAPLAALLPMEVPLINKVAAGYPTEFTDLGYPARVAAEYVRAPDLADPDAFACRVVGDSMTPEYREGDIVVFSPARAVKNGSDCFARIEPDHETTFKRAYFEVGVGGEELIRLQPLNPAYPARVYPRERVAGLYAAVSVTRAV
jgi:SOS-response transcriptional repressor LexA